MSCVNQRGKCNQLPFLPPSGDAGYALSPQLLTPYRRPTTVPQRRYNRAHIRTRAIIERTFGLLKSRFRCLDRSGGVLMYSPEVVCKIILACCVLHNIAVKHGLHIPLVPRLAQNLGNRANPPNRGQGLQVRDELVATFFT